MYLRFGKNIGKDNYLLILKIDLCRPLAIDYLTENAIHRRQMYISRRKMQAKRENRSLTCLRHCRNFRF